MRTIWTAVALAGGACAYACVTQPDHPVQQAGRAPAPPAPGTPDADPAEAPIDAPPPPVVLSFAPAPWARGDRIRIELDEGAQKDVTSVLIDTAEPLAIVAMIDKRKPDAEHAVGTSCAASLEANGPAAAQAGLACALATHRLAALVDLVAVASAPRTAGDHADGLGRLPLDLIGATPGKTSAVLESFLDHDRAVLVVDAEGTRAGKAVHLRGRVTVDRALTTAVGNLEGTDGDAKLAVFFDLGPAD